MVVFFARRLFLKDKTGFQAWSQCVWLVTFIFLFLVRSSWERDLTALERNWLTSPGAIQQSGFVSLGVEPGKRAPDSPSFPGFCLFKLLVFEWQLSSLSKDNSIWSLSGGNFLFLHRVLHISTLPVYIWGWQEGSDLGSVKSLGGRQVFVPFFENKGTESRNLREMVSRPSFPSRGQVGSSWGSEVQTWRQFSADYLSPLGQQSPLRVCPMFFPVCKLWILQGLFDSLTSGNLHFPSFSPCSGEGIKCRCAQFKKKGVSRTQRISWNQRSPNTFQNCLRLWLCDQEY